MRQRRYKGRADLDEMQAIVRERTRVMGPCTNLHPGDVAHRIHSGLRAHDLGDVVAIWEDESGITGFGIIWPGDRAFDVVTRVGLEREALVDIVGDLAGLAGDGDSVDGAVGTDVVGGDPDLTAALIVLGFTRGETDYVVARTELRFVGPTEPRDYAVRSVRFADAQQLASVHSGAFGSGWSARNYEDRMRKPGYDPHDEIVAVDTDGTFMGFAVTWYDELNQVGYFEPVGVHRDFHRRGIGSALLQEGKRRMQSRGMTNATVLHAKNEERVVRFYRSNGFKVCKEVMPWRRTAFDGAIPLK